MSDTSGGTPPVHDYPGQDRPAGPGAESGAVVGDGQLAPGGEAEAMDDVATPSEMAGASDDAPDPER